MSISWEAIGHEAAELLAGYIRQRTVNPPGDEALGADYLRGLLAARGLQPVVWPSAPGRANLLATCGDPHATDGVILMHHIDVVAADGTGWRVPPFAGEVRDGYVWGRGALDNKALGIMHLLALDLLRREGVPLRRPVLYLAAANEEDDGAGGVPWLLANHRDELRAAYVWDEGSFGMRETFGPGTVFPIAVADKGVLWLRLTVEGEAGLGSVPRGANAPALLAAALARLQRHRWPVHLLPVVRDLLRVVSALQPIPKRWLLRHLDLPPVLALAGPALLREPMLRAILQTTASVTGLRAGDKENVVPARAEAVLDVRLLPGQDPEAIVATLRRVLAEPRLRIDVIQAPRPSSVTPYAGDPFYQALQQSCQGAVPGCHVAPLLSPGTTDSGLFRPLGYRTFGLVPAVLTSDDLTGMHGVDERISIANLALGTRIVYETLRRVCTLST